MRQIDSRHFQIFGKDEYWRIPYVKVSSRDYSLIYVRMAENVTNIPYSPILGHSWRIDICAVQPLDFFFKNVNEHFFDSILSAWSCINVQKVY